MTNVQDFGAAGDGKADDTEAIQHAVNDGEGQIDLPRGDYLITKPIEVDTTKLGRIAIRGGGGTAKLIMAGAGPAIRLIGNHGGTADPGSMKPEIWREQRMPSVAELEIEGRHAEADGIELTGTVQPIIRRVGLRRLRHGVRLVKRNRNVLIDGCQIYHNTGAGVFMDGVNLHQINIIGNHISYNRLGGIRIERSEVRNLQITGNDIEYNTNRTHKIKDEPTAEIYIDATADAATVNEVTIASNTIQARPSPAGANIRIIEDAAAAGRPPGLYAITGNVIGSQTNNVHLTGCYGITLTGNSIYSAKEYNLLLEKCRQIVVGANHFRRHTPDRGTGVKLVESTDCLINGCHIYDEAPEGQASGLPLLTLEKCLRISVAACQLIGGVPSGLLVRDSRDCHISSCLITDDREKTRAKHAADFQGDCTGTVLSGCQLSKTTQAVVHLNASGVTVSGNSINGGAAESEEDRGDPDPFRG